MSTQSVVRLVRWSPPKQPDAIRLYVHGLPGVEATWKVWIAPARAGWRLLASQGQGQGRPDGALRQAMLDALRRQGQLAPGADPEFAQLLSLAAAPTRRAAPPPLVPQSFRDTLDSLAPDRVQAAAASVEWRRAQAESLDPASIPIPGPVEILVDHREPDQLLELIALHPMARVQRAALAVGDIAINNDGQGDPDGTGWRVLVERKDCTRCPSDFDRSITQSDKRLFHQVEALAASDAIGILLLEGDVHRTATGMDLIQQVDGFLTFAAVIQQVSVLPTLSLRHSAYVALKLAQHQRYGLGYALGLRSAKPRSTLDAARFVLEGLPGVNAELAGRLLDTFGSIRVLAQADEAALRRVPGIGPTKARDILSCLAAGPSAAG